MEIEDRSNEAEGGGPVRKAAREKSDPDVLGSVGAPMAGEVIEVSAKPGWSCLVTCVYTVMAALDSAQVVEISRVARNATHA